MILTSISYQSITFFVYEQECLFSEVVAGLMRINDYGRIAQREWERLPARFKNIALEAFVVMPNHVHGIIVIADESGGVGARQDISKTLAHNRPAVPLPDNPKNIIQANPARWAADRLHPNT